MLQAFSGSKFFLLAGALVVVVALSGCSFFKDKTDLWRQSAQDAVDNAKVKVESVVDQVETAKDNINQKVTDIKDAAREVQEAAEEVNEAIDAVKKATGGEAAGGDDDSV